MRRPRPSRPLPARAFLALAAAMTLQASSAGAVVRTWFSATTGSASTASLWSPAAVPIAGDVAQFTIAGAYTVTWTSPQDTLSSLDVTGGTPAFSMTTKLGVLNNFSLSNSGRATVAAGRVSANRLRVGGTGYGRLIISGAGSEVRTRSATAATTVAETTSTSAGVYVLAEGQLLSNSWIETARKSASTCSLVVNGGNLVTKVGSRLGTLAANVSGSRGDVYLSLLGTTYMDVSNGGVFDVKGNLVVGQRGTAVLRMYDTSAFLDPSMFVYGSTFVGYNALDALPAAHGTLSIEGSTARLGGGLYIGDPDHTTGNSDFGKLVTRGGTTIVGGTGITMPTSLAGSIEMVGGTLQLLAGNSNILQASPFNISSGAGSPLLWVNGTAGLTVSQSGLDPNALGIGRGGAGRLRLAGVPVSVTSMHGTMIADSAGGAGILEVDSSAVFTGRGDMVLGSGGHITVSNGGQLVLLSTPQEPITDLASNGSITLNGGTVSAYEGWFNGPGIVSGHGEFIGTDSKSVWENRTGIVIPAPDTMKFYGSFVNRGGSISGGGTLYVDNGPTELTGVVAASLRTNFSTLRPHAPADIGLPPAPGPRQRPAPARALAEPPLGHLHLLGNLSLSAISSTEIRIGSMADGLCDTVEVDSTASIHGVLDLLSIPGSVRAPGDTLTLLTAGSVVGTFEEVYLDGDFAGDSLLLVYTPTAVKVVFPGSVLAVDDNPHGGPAPMVLRFAAHSGPGVTAFVLDLPAAAQVQLRLYDVSGREVARLADDELAAGRHSFPVQGRSLASGMYFARAWIDTKGQRSVMTARAPLIR